MSEAEDVLFEIEAIIGRLRRGRLTRDQALNAILERMACAYSSTAPKRWKESDAPHARRFWDLDEGARRDVLEQNRGESVTELAKRLWVSE